MPGLGFRRFRAQMQGGGRGVRGVRGGGGEFEILFLLFVWLGTEAEMYKRVGDWFPWLRAGGGAVART